RRLRRASRQLRRFRRRPRLPCRRRSSPRAVRSSSSSRSRTLACTARSRSRATRASSRPISRGRAPTPRAVSPRRASRRPPRARELAARGAAPTIVVADEQTAGLGTKGRRWDAPRGTSLLGSWLFRPAPGEAGVFVLLAGVAIARALEGLGAHDVLLKWPNDV